MLIRNAIVLSAICSSVAVVKVFGDDHAFGIVMIGDSGVGKTQILERFTNNTFNDVVFDPRVGYKNELANLLGDEIVGFVWGTKLLDIDGKKCRLTIFDSTGRLENMPNYSNYYRRGSAYFLVFDIANKKSFQRVKELWDRVVIHMESYDVVNYAYKHVKQIYVVGNKLDLVDTTHAQSLACVVAVHWRSLSKIVDRKKRFLKYSLLGVSKTTLHLIFNFLRDPNSEVRQVPAEEVQAFLRDLETSRTKPKYFEVSARNDIRIQELFEETARSLMPVPSRRRSFFRSFGNLFRHTKD